MKLTAEEFNELTIESKATYLWENGYFVDERISYNKYIIKVYSLPDFYAEVYYSISDNKIEDIYALGDNEEDWEGVLKNIDLRDLFLLFFLFLPFLSSPQCLKEPKLSFSPQKEIYQSNDTISIKFEFLYERIDANWLSAINIDYSDTWDLIPPYSVPNNCCSPKPFWEWDKKQNNKGKEMQGFFFTDDRTDQIYGDNCLCFGCGSEFIDHFLFSWKMVVNSCENVGDLILVIDTYSDSERGSWNWKGCYEDEVVTARKKKDCFTTKK